MVSLCVVVDEYAMLTATAPISSAVWHPAGVVLATCSGTRLPRGGGDDASDSEDEEKEGDTARADGVRPDNALKIWTV